MELVSTARNAIPSGARPGSFTAKDGAVLRYALWGTTATERKGTVCLFGGRTEFIEKYFETITDLRRRGFAVATMDWRGQGGSSRPLSNPMKGHVESFAQFDGDLAQFMTQVVLPDCPPPFFGMAHSMGGHILLRSAQTKVCWFDRIILCAPMIELAPQSTRIPALKVVSEAATLLGMGDMFVPGGRGDSWRRETFEGNAVTSDKLRFDRARDVLDAGPWLALGSPTIGWVAAAQKSIAEINQLAFTDGIKVPTLILAAGNDEIVSTPAIELFAARLKTCTRIVIAGAKHEILQERDELRDQFWAAFDAFIPGAQGAGPRALGL
ncbi:MAG: alpha/beta hydrolase [Hyphomicrobiales bacterium]|nr:alpha/beta hydrolase [Hyphomicrobiales bacterium]